MARSLPDAEIQRLIEEEKVLPADWRDCLNLKMTRDAQLRGKLEVTGSDGSCFVVHLRRLESDVFCFSAILAYKRPDTGTCFLLRRYNGKDHTHTNKIEKDEIFFDFHIHKATHRYQDAGLAEDQYAEVTDKYSTINEAYDLLLTQCGFVKPYEKPGLF